MMRFFTLCCLVNPKCCMKFLHVAGLISVLAIIYLIHQFIKVTQSHHKLQKVSNANCQDTSEVVIKNNLNSLNHLLWRYFYRYMVICAQPERKIGPVFEKLFSLYYEAIR